MEQFESCLILPWKKLLCLLNYDEFSKIISFIIDIQDSCIPFGSSEINVRVISLSDDHCSDELRELDCICEDTSKFYRVRLEGIWSSTPVKIGSSLRIIGAKMIGKDVISHRTYSFLNLNLNSS